MLILAAGSDAASRPLRTIVPLALLLLAAFALACGGDDGGGGDASASAETVQYFDEFREANMQYRSRVQAPLDPSVTVAEGQDEGTAENLRFFAVQVPALEEGADSIRASSVPDELAELHDQHLRALDEFIEITRGVQTRLVELAERNLGIGGLANDPEYGIARYDAYGQRVTDACLTLQSYARAQGIEESLRCSGSIGEMLEDEDESLVLDPASCDAPAFFDAVPRTSTFVQFVNESSDTINVYETRGTRILLLTIQPGDAGQRGAEPGTLFTIESASGECMGKYSAEFPPRRVIIRDR